MPFFVFRSKTALNNFSYLPEKEGETLHPTPPLPPGGTPDNNLNLSMKKAVSSFFYSI